MNWAPNGPLGNHRKCHLHQLSAHLTTQTRSRALKFQGKRQSEVFLSWLFGFNYNPQYMFWTSPLLIRGIVLIQTNYEGVCARPSPTTISKRPLPPLHNTITHQPRHQLLFPRTLISTPTFILFPQHQHINISHIQISTWSAPFNSILICKWVCIYVRTIVNGCACMFVRRIIELSPMRKNYDTSYIKIFQRCLP